MPKFRSIPLLSPNPIAKPPTAPQPRRTVKRPAKKRLHRTRGASELRPQQSQMISPEPTSGQSSEDYPIVEENPPSMSGATPRHLLHLEPFQIHQSYSQAYAVHLDRQLVSQLNDIIARIMASIEPESPRRR